MKQHWQIIVTTKIGYTLLLQIQVLRSDIATILEILIMHSALKVIEAHLAVKKFVFYDAKSSYCLLCLKEKYLIINYPHKNFLLNKRS